MASSPPSTTDSTTEGGRRPIIKLLPRTVPTSANAELPYNSSIFGTGKPRDLNNPEIRKLEERLEKTLSVTTPAVASSSTTSAVSESNDRNE